MKRDNPLIVCYTVTHWNGESLACTFVWLSRKYSRQKLPTRYCPQYESIQDHSFKSELTPILPVKSGKFVNISIMLKRTNCVNCLGKIIHASFAVRPGLSGLVARVRRHPQQRRHLTGHASHRLRVRPFRTQVRPRRQRVQPEPGGPHQGLLSQLLHVYGPADCADHPRRWHLQLCLYFWYVTSRYSLLQILYFKLIILTKCWMNY